ncbi:hypothetical protein EG346_21890 [Chryseobacterium carnipullorum]|uniref:Yip1 domain-containing protein n=1 Tax=Chryseobacterium carnipullorum TaxID=1124835 RepID=A0A1M7JJ97_CHRCU|nr:hypothetical protein [Chryseobacterium carnipullorum]AZA50663.1 hypothetical protein EG346_21890 [Chryseobacterium carnipullorum]AZA65530.1 hypothetical protein EG345_12980 [Chryseobacterium carnipullorum]SHM53122.1 hypothetical protein SAMN05444360_11378 [Chryseobacterium carnipullorum]STD01193.1 Uncharacterised protein [Chryseobacterium carnipullorum]HBV14793.1 hypothetical protein [Chryseobacterium carnipullorum]
MEFDKLLDSFEKLCLRILTDLLLLPGTVFTLFRNPKLCYDLAEKEVHEDSELQDDDILSPVRFSIYTSVATSLIIYENNQIDFPIAKLLGSLNFTEKAIIIFFFNNMTAIMMSLIITLLNKERISGLGFRKYLFAFLYTSIYMLFPIILLFFGMAAAGGSLNLKTTVFDGSNSSTIKILSIFIVSFILFIMGFYKLIRANYHIIKESLFSRKYLIAINILAITLEIGCILFLQ